MTFSKNKNIGSKKKRNRHDRHDRHDRHELKSKKNKELNENTGDKKIREKITDILELPKEVVLNISKMTMIGNQEIIIENYKGVVEYGTTLIRINIGNCLLKITGKNLCINEITSEDIKISGQIGSLEFQN